MIHPKTLFNLFQSHGYGPYISIPCSILKSFINYIMDQPAARYYAATDEGEALGIASGMRLAGKKPVVMIQNSGLGNMIDTLTSLSLVFNIPILLVISWRGEPEKKDEPQHRVMGSLMKQFLDVMEVEYEILGDEKPLKKQVKRLTECMNRTCKPAAFIVPKGVFEPYESKKDSNGDPQITMQRQDAIKTIVQNLKGDEVLISSTGKISRELYFMDKKVQAPFYVLGSMGCAGSLAFGVAETMKAKKVVVLDGDGALLMKMGILATIGHYKPKNFVHIVLDNESHESTGGQQTVSSTAHFEKIAEASGYKNTARVYTRDKLIHTLKEFLQQDGPSFIEVKVLKGSDLNLGRPRESPEELKNRFIKNL